MVSEWKEYSLTDLYSVSSGLSKPAKDFGQGYPFLSFKDVFYNFFLPDGLTELVRSNDKERNTCSIKRGDVFLTRTSETMDELGMSSVARKDYPDATFNGFCKRLRPSTHIPLYPEYVGYSLRSPRFRLELTAFSTMSTRASLNNDMIGRLKLTLPPLPEQKAIAHILRSLDDKIELNRRMNVTLEGMAQALFKSWFVDFDPVIDNAIKAGNPIPEELAERAVVRRQALADGIANREAAKLFPATFQLTEEMGWIPNGWEAGVISDLFELHRGFDLSATKRKNGQIPVYSAGGIHGNHSEFKIEAPGIITGRSGVIGNVFLSLTPFWPLNTTLYVREFRKSGPYYTLHFLKNIDLTIYNSGSAVPSLNRNFVHSTPTFIPHDNILSMYEQQAGCFFRKIKVNDMENDILTNLRDTLLPKLISGELCIPEAEKLSEEALP